MNSPVSKCTSGRRRPRLTRWSRTGLDGRLSRKVLRRLGVDVDLAIPGRHPRFEAFFPCAEGRTYWPLMRDAQSVNEVVEPWLPQRELDWLAEEMRIAALGDDCSWARLWRSAADQSGLRDAAPRELGPDAKRFFLGRLATSANYSALLRDTLAEALEYEASTRSAAD